MNYPLMMKLIRIRLLIMIVKKLPMATLALYKSKRLKIMMGLQLELVWHNRPTQMDQEFVEIKRWKDKKCINQIQMYSKRNFWTSRKPTWVPLDKIKLIKRDQMTRWLSIVIIKINSIVWSSMPRVFFLLVVSRRVKSERPWFNLQILSFSLGSMMSIFVRSRIVGRSTLKTRCRKIYNRISRPFSWCLRWMKSWRNWKNQRWEELCYRA